jgi:hypothetical protein
MTSTSTPTSPIQRNITDILQEKNNTLQAPQATPNPSSVTINSDTLSNLLLAVQRQQDTISKLTPALVNSSSSSMPTTQRHTQALSEYYNNAKYEEIICKPIKPIYDGSAEQLVPFLNCLDIRRQDESWYPITFLHLGTHHLDLTRHFTQIDESVMLNEAKLRWSSTDLSKEKFSLDHPTYNARVLARLLLNSITNNFAATIINRIHHDLRNDGPLILWTICNNMHRNNVAFIETIKAKIQTATLTEFGDDIEKYIIHIKNNLRLITSTDDHSREHNDIIIYNFQQLSLSTIPLFQESIQKWHIKYLEAKTPSLTPTKLLKDADDKMQVLCHAGQWKQPENTAVMALKLELDQQRKENDKLAQHISAHIGRLTQHGRYPPGGYFHPGHGINSNNNNNLKCFYDQNWNPRNYPVWMITPPQNPTDTQVVECRIYRRCSRYRNGQGLWVNHHTTNAHEDGYRSQCRRLPQHRQYQPAHSGLSQPPPFPTNDNTNQPPPQHPPIGLTQGTPQVPRAQLSIFDYMDAYLPPEQDATAEHETP